MHTSITRPLAALLFISATLLALTSLVFAQSDRALSAEAAIEGTLAPGILTQVYTYEGVEEEQVTLTVSNEIGETLALVLTDAFGDPVATQSSATVGGYELSAELPATGTYYVTVVSPSAIEGEIPFTVTVESTAGLVATDEVTAETTDEATVEATTALEATVETTAIPQFPLESTLPAVIGSTAEATLSPETTVDPSVSQVITASGLQVSLDWASTDDLDLEVRDPVGGSLYWQTPTVPSGGTITANANQQCVQTVSPANETASWPSGGLDTGSYEVLVYFQQSCNNNIPTEFTVSATVDGTPLTPVVASLLPSEVYVFSFDVNADGTEALNTTGGIDEPESLPAPASQIVAAAQPITVGQAFNGFISNEAPYQAFTFNALGTEVYNIAAVATTGSLDTFVGLLDASGNLVRFNDDVDTGITDSTLTNVLVADGTYTIFVSRYGKENGGTEGDYTLTVSSQVNELPISFFELPTGNLQVLLTWNNNADLQLLLRDPTGDAIFDDVPQVGGGRLGASGNVNCTNPDGDPFSYIYYPTDVVPRSGSYEVEVQFQNECADTTPVSFNLYVIYNGQQVFSDVSQPILRETYVTSFDITAENNAVSGPGGIIRGVQDLPWQSEVASASAILPSEQATGTIATDNRFDVYTFEGEANSTVNIAMNATSGTLDPTLYLVGPGGQEVASNDDAVAGENTNSLIANLTLPADGQYIIIATHYGGPYGGTIGTYQLAYTQLN